MRTVTFYSYKGGVGRTLALANVAEYLAMFKKRVCLIDFDLEAPGLNYKLEEKTGKDIDIPYQKGIVDYMHYFFVESQQTAFRKNLKEFTIDVTFPNHKHTPVTYIPAGNVKYADYWKKLSELEWHKFFNEGKRYGIPFFLELKARIEKELKPDILLIDCRTGISEILGFTTSILADHAVVLGANNKENLDGCILVMKSLAKSENHIHKKPLKLHFVQTRIPYPENEGERLREKKQLKDVKEKLDESLGENTIEKVLVIHSDRELLWEEKLKISGDRKEPIVQDYLNLFDAVTDGFLNRREEEKLNVIIKAEELFNKAYRERGLNKKLKWLNESIKLNPTPNAYHLRAIIYKGQDLYNEALEDYEKAITLNSEDALIFYNRGVLYNSDSKHEEALQDYNKAIELNPKFSFAYINRGILYSKLGGKNEEALQDFNKAIEIDSLSDKAYFNRGVLYSNLGKNEEALQDFNKAIEIDSEYADAYNNRADLLRKMGEYEQAFQNINKALMIDSNDAYTHSTLAEIYAETGEETLFYENTEKALELGCPVWEFIDDKAYDNYRNSPRFKKLLAKYQNKADS